MTVSLRTIVCNQQHSPWWSLPVQEQAAFPTEPGSGRQRRRLTWLQVCLLVPGACLLGQLAEFVAVENTLPVDYSPLQTAFSFSMMAFVLYGGMYVVVAVPIWIVYRGIMRRPRDSLPSILIWALVPTFALWATFIGVQRDAASKNRADSIPPDAAVTTLTSVQSNEGATQADFTTDALEGLEAWVVKTFERQARSRYEAAGGKQQAFDPGLGSNSVFLMLGAKRLAVIRVRFSAGVRAVVVLGLRDDELVRVQCTRASDHEIDVTSGVCAQAIQREFGRRRPD